jgi:putative restriction endonuclease
MELDSRIRVRTFQWLVEQTTKLGEVLPHRLLSQGFDFEGHRVPLLGPQGIFRPKHAAYPISIRTSPESPYDDSFSAEGLLAYRFRGSDPDHHDNVGLTRALSERVPLVYLYGVMPGRYLPVWPVYVVRADRSSLTFTVAVDDASSIEALAEDLAGERLAARRAYVTAMVRRRLHQTDFRELVMRAYREQCALCRLRHAKLLDAAHIIEDSDPRGEPDIRNGIALCKLHHAAFDAMMIGITPEYRIEIRRDLLDEPDGPMLEHGLKNLHSSGLILPRRREMRPDPQLLDHRYQAFRRAS